MLMDAPATEPTVEANMSTPEDTVGVKVKFHQDHHGAALRVCAGRGARSR
jgi:hypothetical protein